MPPCTQHCWLNEQLQKANSSSGRQQVPLLLFYRWTVLDSTHPTHRQSGWVLFPPEHTQRTTGIAYLAGSLSPGTQGHLQQQQILSRLVQSLQSLLTLPGKPECASSTRRNNPALHKDWQRSEGNGSVRSLQPSVSYSLCPYMGTSRGPAGNMMLLVDMKGKAIPELSAHEDRVVLFWKASRA